VHPLCHFLEKKGTPRKSWVLQYSRKWHGDVIKNKIKELPERGIGCTTFQKKRELMVCNVIKIK